MAWQGAEGQQAEWHHSLLHLQPHRTHLPVRPILPPHPPSPLLLSTGLSLLSIERVPLSAFFSSFPLLLLLSFSSSPLLLFSFDPLLIFPSPLLLYPSPPVLIGLDNNQLTGELPSFHHMPNLTEPYSLHVHNNYFTTTPDPSDTHMLCLLHHNCLHGSTTDCASWQDQRRASECRAFCGAQPLTPPCSGHGVCFIEPDSSRDMTACYDDVYDPPPPYCTPEGHPCSGGDGSVCSPDAWKPAAAAAAAAATGGAGAAGLLTAAAAEAPQESTPHTLLLFKESPCCPASCHGCGDYSLAPLL
ncbi:unnamed protein product [Closterium sp. NIES-64]|nr:unnamed protein product [Closterium sp. NIES-64]